MSAREDIARWPRRVRIVFFAVVAAVLAVSIWATRFVRELRVDRIEQASDEHSRRVVTTALDRIEGDFQVIQRRLLDRAEQVASVPAVAEGLEERVHLPSSTASKTVVDYFSDLAVPYGMSVELYDADVQLVAWHGFSMPLGEMPDSLRFGGAFRTGIARDDDFRQALVAWWPVRAGPRVLGAVRAMHLIDYEPPVRNTYIQDISLLDRWNRLAGLPIDLDFDPMGGATSRSRLLYGADGTVLCRVSVHGPSTDRLIDMASTHPDHLLFVLIMLSFGWMGCGIWFMYRRRLRALRVEFRRGTVWSVVGWFVFASAWWWVIRFMLITYDIPGRWHRGTGLLASLFDPIRFASGSFWGLLHSLGDFLLTGLFLLAFALAFLELVYVMHRPESRMHAVRERLEHGVRSSAWGMLPVGCAVIVCTMVVAGLSLIVAFMIRQTVLDSTFDLFARRAIVPDPHLLIAFCALILVALSVTLLSVGVARMTLSAVLRRAPFGVSPWVLGMVAGASALVPLWLLYAASSIGNVLPWPVPYYMIAVAFGLVILVAWQKMHGSELVALRNVIPFMFLVTVLFYPVYYVSLDAERRMEMSDAVDAFSKGLDPRVRFAVEQLLSGATNDEDVQHVLAGHRGKALDSMAVALFRRLLPVSLPAYDLRFTIYDAAGVAVGRYFDTGQALDSLSIAQIDPLPRHMLYVADSREGMVMGGTGSPGMPRFRFESIVPVVDDDTGDPLGWVVGRAESSAPLAEGAVPIPRVVLPSGSYENLFADLSIAEFRGGLLVRSIGRYFDRRWLPDEVQQVMATTSGVWRSERINGRRYYSYYVWKRASAGFLDATSQSSPMAVVAVRKLGITSWDHLFYLLRLFIAGLVIGFFLYLIGIVVRRRMGLLPAPRVLFRHRVLNAFVVVGIVMIGAVGLVGRGAISVGNEQDIQIWLRRHLEQVEQLLAMNAHKGERPYSVLGRTRLDSLATHIGFDLNVYEGHSIANMSRPQLVLDRVVDQRLPIQAYKALYVDGYGTAYTNEQVGRFTYKVGFRALPDEQGRPGCVMSIPILPEQEWIDEGRARIAAYVFGSLLLLIVVVMAMASLLANAVARPIGRLRTGLQTVAAGRFQNPLPIRSRDEIGELVGTFNEMQRQLAESRLRLVRQERQLAWREMARQVAHEIKNSLTPMKLSVQHLRQAFEHAGGGKDGDGGSGVSDGSEASNGFGTMFDRITFVLMEQIDRLARIADEFHSFGRMPPLLMGHVNVNVVLEGAVALMCEESETEIAFHPSPKPLFVEADGAELRGCYINLIKNAMQSIEEPRDGLIEVRAGWLQEDEESWAYTTISDNGVGIGPEVRSRVFEPNFSTKTHGAGLGLPIVRKSIEEMHGKVGFRTNEGMGTTFWVQLPLTDIGEESAR